jgi:hypothetical protein
VAPVYAHERHAYLCMCGGVVGGVPSWAGCTKRLTEYIPPTAARHRAALCAPPACSHAAPWLAWIESPHLAYLVRLSLWQRSYGRVRMVTCALLPRGPYLPAVLGWWGSKAAGLRVSA